LLKQGQTARAAWRSLPPQRRAGLREDDPNLKNKLEERVAEEGGAERGGGKAPAGGGGQHSQFLQQELVRLITLGGADTTFESTGLKEWSLDKGGYRVVLTYRVQTPECGFDARIILDGTDSPVRGEPRQWAIDLRDSGVEGEVRFTEAGRAME